MTALFLLFLLISAVCFAFNALSRDSVRIKVLGFGYVKINLLSLGLLFFTLVQLIEAYQVIDL